MEHVARSIGHDPLEFRMKNMLGKGDALLEGGVMEDEENPAKTLIEQVKESSKYAQRRTVADQFNRVLELHVNTIEDQVMTSLQDNKWKKKGLSLIPVRYQHRYFGTNYHVLVSCYAHDGTVAVITGGIEMGQGLNTKVAQVVAAELGITLDMVKVKPACNVVGANNSVTGGSMGSECCASVRTITI